MKTLFLTLALVIGFAAPSMAVEFNNNTVGAFGTR